MTSKISTRNKFNSLIFGIPEDISQINLPTYGDMLSCCFFERLNLVPKTRNKEPSFSRIAENIATKIEVDLTFPGTRFSNGISCAENQESVQKISA
ncbi:hypothetical protein AVEN_173677-1 [Araneus ventricosus]|uniref:Uncharacterized protein n=1 Tax=Araneus ventricosus TaxID=182803 RepID=A0A4Y2PYC8_ARAVE|nr:hypothetical protein AVEN_173677-1 [Araneus ventricosus]